MKAISWPKRKTFQINLVLPILYQNDTAASVVLVIYVTFIVDFRNALLPPLVVLLLQLLACPQRNALWLLAAAAGLQ